MCQPIGGHLSNILLLYCYSLSAFHCFYESVEITTQINYFLLSTLLVYCLKNHTISSFQSILSIKSESCVQHRIKIVMEYASDAMSDEYPTDERYDSMHGSESLWDFLIPPSVKMDIMLPEIIELISSLKRPKNLIIPLLVIKAGFLNIVIYLYLYIVHIRSEVHKRGLAKNIPVIENFRKFPCRLSRNPLPSAGTRRATTNLSVLMIKNWIYLN